MAKIKITLDEKFLTKNIATTDIKSFEEVLLKGKEAIKFFTKVPNEELTFEVLSTNPDCQASFPFSSASGHKDAIFDVSVANDGNSLSAFISGTFSLDLRAGVAKELKACGPDLDLRIRGIMWKGGAYRGFMASVAGGDYDQESENWASTFPKIVTYEIK